MYVCWLTDYEIFIILKEKSDFLTMSTQNFNVVIPDTATLLH